VLVGRTTIAVRPRPSRNRRAMSARPTRNIAPPIVETAAVRPCAVSKNISENRLAIGVQFTPVAKAQFSAGLKAISPPTTT